MTPNPTTPAPTTEEWMTDAARAYLLECRSIYPAVMNNIPVLADYIARHYAAAHPAGTEEQPKKGLDDLKFGLSGRLNNFGEFVSTAQIGLNGEPKTVRIRVCGKDKDAVNQMAQRLALTDTKLSNAWSNNDHYRAEIASLITALAEAKELLREIRDNEVNASDEADKFLRDHVPSELSKAKARCAELEKVVAEELECRERCWHELNKTEVKEGNDIADAIKEMRESAEAQRDRMKAALEELTECYFKRRSEGLLELMMRAATLSTPPAEEKP